MSDKLQKEALRDALLEVSRNEGDIDGEIDHPEGVKDPGKKRGHGLYSMAPEVQKEIVKEVLNKRFEDNQRNELYAPYDKEHLIENKIRLNEALMKWAVKKK